MKIVVQNHHQDLVGGIETYVDRLIRLLAESGHEVYAVFDLQGTDGRSMVSTPVGVRVLTVANDGLDSTVRSINAIDGAVVFANSLDSPLFRRGPGIKRPVAYYAHDYVASCISGTRVHRLPSSHPCERRFGAACLVQYFPRRCGGLNPLTMLRSYQRESRNRRMLRDFDLVVANSDSVAGELRREGIDAVTLHPFIDDGPGSIRSSWLDSGFRSIGFCGRFEDYKGGQVLLEALPIVADRLSIPVRVTMAGDGSQRERWTSAARDVERLCPRVRIEFPGWLSPDDVQAVYRSSDLIVMPSLWPEPFGLVGPEAAQYGAPTAAFAVGGIPEWLSDGENGHLAAGEFSPALLADAIIRCLSDFDHYVALSAGAVCRRERFSAGGHVRRVVQLLEGISRS